MFLTRSSSPVVQGLPGCSQRWGCWCTGCMEINTLSYINSLSFKSLLNDCVAELSVKSSDVTCCAIWKRRTRVDGWSLTLLPETVWAAWKQVPDWTERSHILMDHLFHEGHLLSGVSSLSVPTNHILLDTSKCVIRKHNLLIQITFCIYSAVENEPMF